MKLSKSYLNLGLLVATLVFVAGTAGALPPPAPAPDAGSTSLLLGLSVMGLAAIKRFIRR
jgi:hypothetical protein